MPSTITFGGVAPTPKQSIYQPKASVTQTYMIAHQARHKLAKEAGRPDHNLFRLVCHANMLDSLIYDLAHAEEEQESYLYRLTNGSKAAAAAPKKATDNFQTVMSKLDESDSEDESDVETEASLSSEDSDEDEFESWDEFAGSSPVNLSAADKKADELASVLVVAEADADELQEKAAKISITSKAPPKPLRQSKSKATPHR